MTHERGHDHVCCEAVERASSNDVRLHQESEQRHRWLTASAAMTRQLFAQQDGHPLDMVLSAAQQAADADVAVLALLTAPADHGPR
ncbi:hypothetical protein ACIRG5_24045 [Lentzea sp. NPDC102401]|uniref:hypothetical protein n=1 Tax=Lentzea sp. NPDC102401 TaxID=3364128 RepID=UPI003819A5D4